MHRFVHRTVTEKWISVKRKKRLPVILAVLFVLTMTYLLFSRSSNISLWLEAIEEKAYDFQLRRMYRPLSKNPSVAIVAIDDKSIEQVGKLPWTRKNMALLLENIQSAGARVVAFGFMFTEKEPNIADEVIRGIPDASLQTLQELREKEENFNYDALFAAQLRKGTSVLSMFLSHNEMSEGVLPEPIAKDSADTALLYVPEKNGFLSDITVLQEAAKFGGFINSTPDFDGVIRRTPLIYRYKGNIYGSLGFVATLQYLGVEKIDFISKLYQETAFLEAIDAAGRQIPVDPSGQMLIPFRGPAGKFPYLSAGDVLQKKIPLNFLNNKLVFIVPTATGAGDLVSTSISPSLHGVEVHASVAEGIIDSYFPYKPNWAKGLSVLLVLVLGLSLAFSLPFLGPVVMTIISASLLLIMHGISYYFWTYKGIVFSFFFPDFVIVAIYLFDIIYGYFSESKHRQAIKEIFGRYVSPEYINLMMMKGIEFSQAGESKELAILFSDIRHFTSLAEQMTASEVKIFLNTYFSAMTEVIFENKGTIDKYIGDAVMAFWGAPLEDSVSSIHAVNAALNMQRKIKNLIISIIQEKKLELRIGIGISTGIVYVGDMGSKYRQSYTVLGDTVNLASRLEGLTKYYFVDVIVSEPTYSQTKDAFIYRKLDRVKVLGKENPVSIFEPICPIQDATDDLKREIEKHHEALQAYTDGNWDAAKEIWKQLVAASPGNQLYSVYLHRMDTTTLPETGWSGIVKFDEK